jgi:hypothetical protein
VDKHKVTSFFWFLFVTLMFYNLLLIFLFFRHDGRLWILTNYRTDMIQALGGVEGELMLQNNVEIGRIMLILRTCFEDLWFKNISV